MIYDHLLQVIWASVAYLFELTANIYYERLSLKCAAGLTVAHTRIAISVPHFKKGHVCDFSERYG
jgi:hypothetical protein